MKYKIISLEADAYHQKDNPTHHRSEDFQKLVNMSLAQGWILYGDLRITNDDHGYRLTFHQAMKYIPCCCGGGCRGSQEE